MEKINSNIVITCYPNEVKDFIKKTVKIGGINQSFYLKGPSGIGKTDIVNQLAEELDAELFDIRLGLYDVIDLNGIGIPDLEKELAIFTRPIFLPPKNGENKKFIIFLDEINHADEKLLGSAYQLTLERRIGTHKLPDNVLIIAAGNRKCDNGIAFNMPAPLVNRFININIEPNIDDWIIYAKENNLDWRIISFLKSNSEYLHKFVPNNNEDNFCTPRNWTKLNPYVDYFDDEKYMSIMLNGTLGLSAFMVFKEYLKLITKIPLMENIIKGTYTVLLEKELSNSYAFSMLCSSYVKNKIKDLSIEEFFNIIKYIELQKANVEVMQMLGIELLTIIKKELEQSDPKKLNDIHFFIFENDYFKSNKTFLNRMKEFNKSIM